MSKPMIKAMAYYCNFLANVRANPVKVKGNKANAKESEYSIFHVLVYGSKIQINLMNSLLA